MSFGDWSIPEYLFDDITSILPVGKTILELGSGDATQEFSHYGYKMFSIEHDKKWLNRFYTTYIYAPLVNNWYNPNFLQNLPEYDLLLIDAPDSKDRFNIVHHLDLFNLDVPIYFDNTDFPPVDYLLRELSVILNRPIVRIGQQCAKL